MKRIYLPIQVCLFFCLLASLSACVDAFTPTLSPNTDLLVVEGIITDQPGPQAVTLSRSRATKDSNVTTPVTSARVEVLVNGTMPLSLTETRPGRYELPAGFRGKVGDGYQLRFTTAQGTRYESGVETMVAVPPILKAFDEFVADGPSQTFDKLPTPTNNIYLSYQDPPGQRNFYRWRWTLYEKQDWCASCQQGRYFLTEQAGTLTGSCVPDPTLKYYNFFEYPCRTLCWDIYYSQGINIFADVYTDGQAQTAQLVAQIPVWQRAPALVDIEQLSLTAGAYRYYKLFADQTQNTGTLADTPPVPTVGNIRNLSNGSENVVGYFSASAVSVNHYWLDRLNATAGGTKGLFYAQHGRSPTAEPPRGDPNVFGSGVPSALCIPGNGRTDQQPVGWH